MSKGRANTDIALSVLFLVLAVIWAAVIFGFSAQDAERSASLSREVAEGMVNTFEMETPPETVEHYVRKSAHFSEYGVFSGLIFGSVAFLLRYFKKSPYKAAFVSPVFCLVYAASDEFHQSFVAGRSPELKDVIIDTSGGIVAAGGICLIMLIVSKARERRAGGASMHNS